MRGRGQVKTEDLGRFRDYLRVLAQIELSRHQRVQRKLDASDLVQDTLLRACRAAEKFRGQSDEQVAAWLRKILARNLQNSIRGLVAERRDFRRERSLEEALDQSSMRLEGLSAAEGPSPSSRFVGYETVARVARILANLPDDQRLAVLLKHWEGRKLEEIAHHMQRTTSSVAGLLRRGLKTLRLQLRSPV